jgi:hypothetical protein
MATTAFTDWVEDLSWLASVPESELPEGLRWPAAGEGGVTDSVDDTLLEVAAVGPGPEAMALLAGLRGVPMSGAARLTVVELWQAQLAWAAGAEQSAIIDLVGTGPDPTDARACLDDEFAPMELAAALRATTVHAAGRITQARLLQTTLKATGDRLRAGTLDPYRVWLIIDETKDLTPDRVQQVEAAVVGTPGESVDAGALSGGQLRKALREACRASDPEWGVRRFAKARKTRRVVFRPEAEDGLVGLFAYLPPVEAMALQQHLEKAAQVPSTSPDDDRCHDERMADALMACVLGSHPGEPTTPLMPEVVMQVLVPLSSLLGLREHSGELAGYGPIPAGMARELAADHEWQRWVYEDDTGYLLDLGKHRYRPTPTLGDHVRARDRYCRFPGCGLPAGVCDLDHTEPFDHAGAAACPAPDADSCDAEQHPGGSTSAANLNSSCRRAHRGKTHGHYQTRQDPDGTLHWITPLGRTYITRPWDYRPKD